MSSCLEAHWLKDARAPPGAMKFKWFLPVLRALAFDGKLRGRLTLDSKAGQSCKVATHCRRPLPDLKVRWENPALRGQQGHRAL